MWAVSSESYIKENFPNESIDIMNDLRELGFQGAELTAVKC